MLFLRRPFHATWVLFGVFNFLIWDIKSYDTRPTIFSLIYSIVYTPCIHSYTQTKSQLNPTKLRNNLVQSFANATKTIEFSPKFKCWFVFLQDQVFLFLAVFFHVQHNTFMSRSFISMAYKSIPETSAYFTAVQYSWTCYGRSLFWVLTKFKKKWLKQKWLKTRIQKETQITRVHVTH